uniref:PUM-HD domain-containing protein n=1 Tax=viral metagenome TaxID=1070528 RepID=A0A6C0H7Z3_9ZZZZ
MLQWNYYLAWNNQLLQMEYEEQLCICKKHSKHLYMKFIILIYNTYNNNTNIYYLLNELSILDNINQNNHYYFINYIILLLINNRALRIINIITNNIYDYSRDQYKYPIIIYLLQFSIFHNIIFKELQLYIIELSKDSIGSKILHYMLEILDINKINYIINILNNYFSKGYKYIYTNYIYQIIIQLYPQNKKYYLYHILNNFIEISTNQYGCIIVYILLEDETIYLHIITNIIIHFNNLYLNKYSFYIILKSIDYITPEYTKQLFNILFNNIILYSIDKYGLRIIKKLINKKLILFNDIYTYNNIIIILNYYKNNYNKNKNFSIIPYILKNSNYYN